MIKREDAFQRAFEEKNSARAKKEAEYNLAVSALSASEPRLCEIERALTSAGAQTAITALSGDTKALSDLKSTITTLNAEREALLKKAGIKSAVYSCELCSDTGYVGGKICECIKNAAKRIILCDLSGELPLDECSFEKFDLNYYSSEDEGGINPRRKMTALLKLCREYAAGFDPKKSENLLFMGNAGLGKTHLSLAVVSELIGQGYDVVYGSAHNLFSQMETEHFSDRTSHSYDAATSCELLVIDDLGSEFTSPYIQTLLFNILNTRLLAKKPTIISTNLSMGEIADRYTARVASRILGSYNAKKFFGKDIRQLKALARHNEGAKNV